MYNDCNWIRVVLCPCLYNSCERFQFFDLHLSSSNANVLLITSIIVFRKVLLHIWFNLLWRRIQRRELAVDLCKIARHLEWNQAFYYHYRLSLGMVCSLLVWNITVDADQMTYDKLSTKILFVVNSKIFENMCIKCRYSYSAYSQFPNNFQLLKCV